MNTLFYHGTSVDGRRFTLAGQYDLEGPRSPEILLGIAICSPSDQFCKRVGRKKAEGRLKSEYFKGSTLSSMYSQRFFIPEGSITRDLNGKSNIEAFDENWFIGKEIDTFVELGQMFEQYTFEELKEEFNLNI